MASEAARQKYPLDNPAGELQRAAYDAGRADALREAAGLNYRHSLDCPNHCDDATTSLLRAEADRIEKEARDE